MECLGNHNHLPLGDYNFSEVNTLHAYFLLVAPGAAGPMVLLVEEKGQLNGLGGKGDKTVDSPESVVDRHIDKGYNRCVDVTKEKLSACRRFGSLDGSTVYFVGRIDDFPASKLDSSTLRWVPVSTLRENTMVSAQILTNVQLMQYLSADYHP